MKNKPAHHIKAKELMNRLGIEDKDSRVKFNRVDGATRKGWRVTVIRLSDGVTMTDFVKDPR